MPGENLRTRFVHFWFWGKPEGGVVWCKCTRGYRFGLVPFSGMNWLESGWMMG
jgi:hypothetical protein